MSKDAPSLDHGARKSTIRINQTASVMPPSMFLPGNGEILSESEDELMSSDVSPQEGICPTEEDGNLDAAASNGSIVNMLNETTAAGAKHSGSLPDVVHEEEENEDLDALVDGPGTFCFTLFQNFDS